MGKLRIQSTHDFGTRGLDAYWTCEPAIQSLILLEGERLPRRIWEPACGMGHIVFPLQKSGRFVVASDIYDYGGVPGAGVLDYLTTPMLRQVEGIVTNPPFRKAQAFAQKALHEVPYVALLARVNFWAEGVRRLGLWCDHPPTRIWLSSRRYPLMHRHGWAGKKSTSNTPYAWVIWERGAPREFPAHFDWREVLGVPKEAGPTQPQRRQKAA